MYETVEGESVRPLPASESQRWKQLLEDKEIGDRTPSEFLRQIQHLAGTSLPNDILGVLWSSRLPTLIDAIVMAMVTVKSDLQLRRLAEVADMIHVHTSRTDLAKVAQDKETDELRKRVASLESQISKLSVSVSRGRSETRARRRSNSRGGETRRRSKSRDGRAFDRSNSRSGNTGPRSKSRGGKHNQSPAGKNYCWYHRTFGNKSINCQAPGNF